MATSMASIVAKKEPKDAVLKAVQLDGQVLLKVVQHCTEAQPHLATGQLLGLDVGHTLEVTDCFPFPTASGDQSDSNVGADYQLDMMRCLREVNVDNNTVGWYQSTLLGTYQTIETIETFVNYFDSNIKKCVCLVYDPQRAARGQQALKAVRVKDTFIEAFKEQKLTADKLRESSISWNSIFQDIPLKVSNSPLVQAMLSDLIPDNPANQSDFDRLTLSTAPYLERICDNLNECVDDLLSEQRKVTLYSDTVRKQQMQQAEWLRKRREENVRRKAAGEEALPEEDPTFKPVPEPTQLEAMLISNQLSNYCDQINLAATQTLQKLYLVDSLQAGLV